MAQKREPAPDKCNRDYPQQHRGFATDAIEYYGRGQVANEVTDTLGSEHKTDEAVGDVKRFGVEWQDREEQATAQSE